MKKAIALTLALLFAVSALSLTACDKDQPAQGNDTAPAGQSEAAGTAAGNGEKTENNETAAEIPTETPAADGEWPAAALNTLTEGKVEIPAFTGACSGFEVDGTTTMHIICTDAESADIKAWYNGLADIGFKDGLFRISDTVFIKASYSGDMLTIAKKDETGKWPYNQMKFDLGYPVDDIMGVSDYTFAYDTASRTVTCTNADADLLDKVVGAFDGSSNWDGTDTENVFSLYKREDSYPDITAAVTLNGSTLTVVFTVS